MDHILSNLEQHKQHLAFMRIFFFLCGIVLTWIKGMVLKLLLSMVQLFIWFLLYRETKKD